jgi:CRP-like cAMP-binding protein
VLYRNKPVSISRCDLADATGLARRTVQLAVAHLKRRRLIQVEQAHETAVPDYSILRPWRRTAVQ